MPSLAGLAALLLEIFTFGLYRREWYRAGSSSTASVTSPPRDEEMHTLGRLRDPASDTDFHDSPVTTRTEGDVEGEVAHYW